MILCVRNGVTEFTEMCARACISGTTTMDLSCVVQERDTGLNVRETDCACIGQRRLCGHCACIGQRKLCGHCACIGQRKLCGHCVCMCRGVGEGKQVGSMDEESQVRGC